MRSYFTLVKTFFNMSWEEQYQRNKQLRFRYKLNAFQWKEFEGELPNLYGGFVAELGSNLLILRVCKTSSSDANSTSIKVVSDKWKAQVELVSEYDDTGEVCLKCIPRS